MLLAEGEGEAEGLAGRHAAQAPPSLGDPAGNTAAAQALRELPPPALPPPPPSSAAPYLKGWSGSGRRPAALGRTGGGEGAAPAALGLRLRQAAAATSSALAQRGRHEPGRAALSPEQEEAAAADHSPHLHLSPPAPAPPAPSRPVPSRT